MTERNEMGKTAAEWDAAMREPYPCRSSSPISQITALPLPRQLQLMQEIAAGEAFNNLTFALVRDLEHILTALHRDATDQAAAENDALHGAEVAMLTDMWVSPCGMRVGY